MTTTLWRNFPLAALLCLSVQGCCMGITPSHHYTCREIILPDLPQVGTSGKTHLPYHKPIEELRQPEASPCEHPRDGVTTSEENAGQSR